MASRYGVKDFLKSFVNVPAWMGADSLRRNAGMISSLARQVFQFKRPPARAETFEQAVQRFNLSEADLARRQKHFGYLASMYLLIAFALASYAAYLYFHHAWSSALMTFVLVMVVSSFAFKEHFWYVQMRQKRLGLTFKDWFLFLIGKVKVDP